MAIGAAIILGALGGGWGKKKSDMKQTIGDGMRQLIAHRGVSDTVPENTLAAAARAVELGFGFIEVDVKKSKDGIQYLFHDRQSLRLFGSDFSLPDKTFAELQELPLWHQGHATNYRVPTLQEFLEAFSEELVIYLDIKRHGNHSYRRLADELMTHLEQAGISERCLIGSDFLFTTYLEFRYPQLQTVFTGPGDWTIVSYRLIPRKFRPDFIISYAEDVTAWHLSWLKKQGLLERRLVYGVDADNYHEVSQWGIPYLVVEYDPIMDSDLR